MALIISVLLAAGSSRRFGSDKLTQALPNGESLAVQSCRNLMTGVDKVIAVVRPGAESLAAKLQAEGAEIVICADADQGMGASLACGVIASADADAWLIALADMPWIAPATITRLADALRAGAIIAAPGWQGQRGHPVGFSKALGAELAGLHGDFGAKAVIQTHLQQLRLIDCGDPGVLRDVDTPDDLKPTK